MYGSRESSPASIESYIFGAVRSRSHSSEGVSPGTQSRGRSRRRSQHNTSELQGVQLGDVQTYDGQEEEDRLNAPPNSLYSQGSRTRDAQVQDENEDPSQHNISDLQGVLPGRARTYDGGEKEGQPGPSRSQDVSSIQKTPDSVYSQAIPPGLARTNAYGELEGQAGPSCSKGASFPSLQNPQPQDDVQQQQPQSYTSQDPALQTGSIIGDYRLTAKIKPAENRSLYRAVHLPTSLEYAVKVLRKGEVPLDSVNLHYSLSRHQNIVSLFRGFPCNLWRCMVMEYYQEGSLDDAIRRGRWGKQINVKAMFLQILDAVEFCHKEGIYHRDIHPRNIVMQGSRVALTGFDFATKGKGSLTPCGNRQYVSPENLSLNRYPAGPSYNCAKNDIWSLGVLLVALTAGYMIWHRATLADPEYRRYKHGVPLHELFDTSSLSDEVSLVLNSVFQEEDQRTSLIPLRFGVLNCEEFTCSSRAYEAIPVPQSVQEPQPVPRPQVVSRSRAVSVLLAVSGPRVGSGNQASLASQETANSENGHHAKQRAEIDPDEDDPDQGNQAGCGFLRRGLGCSGLRFFNPCRCFAARSTNQDGDS